MKRLSTEIRQQQIKKAVLDIIAGEGLSHLSTRNVAMRVGISEGAIFRHFASKQKILLGIMEDVRADLIDQLDAIASGSLPPAERLGFFLRTHLRYLSENHGITILLFSEAAHLNDRELKLHFYEILKDKKRLVSRIIADGMADGIWDSKLNIDTVATLYMGIPITLNIEVVLNAEPPHLDTFCNNMLALLYRLLG